MNKYLPFLRPLFAGVLFGLGISNLIFAVCGGFEGSIVWNLYTAFVTIGGGIVLWCSQREAVRQ